MTLHFLSDVACDAELIQKSKNYIIIASLKRESRFASFDIKFTRLGFEKACCKPRDVNKPCLVNLISKETHLVFSIYQQNFR